MFSAFVLNLFSFGSMILAQEGGGGAGGGDGTGGAGGGGLSSMLIMMVPFFLLMYFLFIRPQKQQEKEHKNMLNALKKKDKVMTKGGVFGTIVSLDDEEAVLCVDTNKDIRIKFTRAAIATVVKQSEGGGDKDSKGSKDSKDASDDKKEDK